MNTTRPTCAYCRKPIPKLIHRLLVPFQIDPEVEVARQLADRGITEFKIMDSDSVLAQQAKRRRDEYEAALERYKGAARRQDAGNYDSSGIGLKVQREDQQITDHGQPDPRNYTVWVRVWTGQWQLVNGYFHSKACAANFGQAVLDHRRGEK